MTPLRIFDYNFIQHIINVNPGSFGQIMEEYYDAIQRHVTKIVINEEDARDLTNEIFAKVYLNLNLFKPNFKFSSWIYKIATNAAIDFLRKKVLRQDIQVRADENINVADDSSEHSDKHEENYATLKEAVLKLKPQYRTILKMRYYEEMSYEDIARRLDCPIGTVKATLHRAKQALSTIITNQKK